MGYAGCSMIRPQQVQKVFMLHQFYSNQGFVVGLCYSIFSFLCMFCRSLFVLMYFFFWPLCCWFFFDLRILITFLVSSNSSFENHMIEEISWNFDVTVNSYNNLYLFQWNICTEMTVFGNLQQFFAIPLL
jgi:hypothetical protein